MLQESQKGSPTRSGSPFDEGQDSNQVKGDGAKQGHSFSFNNNIYNNFNAEHSIEHVAPAKRLLPRID